MVLLEEPTGFVSQHARTKDFNQIGPLSENIFGNEEISHQQYKQLFQYITRDTPNRGQSTTGDVERKWQIERDLSQQKSALIIHQGVRENNNYILTRVMPWKRTDNLIYKKEYVIFDWNDINIVPYGTYAGNVTSSEQETITRLQRYGHGLEFDRTMVRNTAGEKALRYFRAQYDQLTKDIATAATLMALVALKEARSPEEYYKLSFGSFQEEAENTVRKEAAAFLCFARASTNGTNELIPYLQLGIRILKGAGYMPNVLIYPQNAEGLMIRNLEEKTINYFDWDVMNNTMSKKTGTQDLNIIPGTGIAVYTTPEIRIQKYAQKARHDLTHILEETATISEFYVMSMKDFDSDREFTSEHVGIDIWSYVHNNWVRIDYHDAFKNCIYFQEGQHGNLDWNPHFKDWTSHSAVAHSKDDEKHAHSDLHSRQSIFCRSVDYTSKKSPVRYLGDIKIGEGVNAISHKGFRRMTMSIVAKLMRMSTEKIGDVFSSGLHIMRSIADSVPDDTYINDLIAKNTANAHQDGSGIPQQWKDRMKQQYAPSNLSSTDRNSFGFLNLPDKAANLEYPPGFCSFPGLKTISAEANGTSGWKSLGERVKPFVELIEQIDSYLKVLLPDSVLNDKGNIPHYYWTNDTSTLLIQSLMNQFSPCFLDLSGKTSQVPLTKEQIFSTEIEKITDLKTLDDDIKKSISKFMIKMTTQDFDFDPVNFLSMIPPTEIEKIKTADPKDVDKILRNVYNIYKTSKKISVGSDPSSSAKKQKKEYSIPTGANEWYLSPLSATPGVITYIKNYDASVSKATIKILPADPELNFSSPVAQDQVATHAHFAMIHEHLKTENWARSMKNLVSVTETYQKTGASVFDFGESRSRAHQEVHGASAQHDTHRRQFSENLAENIQLLMFEPNYLVRIVSMFLLFSQHVPKTLQHLIRQDCAIPFDIILLRPVINIRTACCILCAAGNAGINPEEDSPLGFVLYIQGYPERTAVQGGIVRDNFYWDMAAIVENPDRVWIQHNAVPVKVVSGLNVGWIKPGTNLFAMRTQEDKNGTMGSLVSIVVSDNWKPHNDILTLIDSDQTKLNKPPGLAYFDKYFNFSSTSTRVTRHNSSNAFGLAMQGTYYTRDHFQKQWSIRQQGTSHISDLVYQGAAEHFRAGGKFKTDYKGR